MNIFRILEPKTLRVTDYWLSQLIIDVEGHLYVVEPVKSSGPRHQTLDVATKHLDEAGRMIGHDKQKQLIIPIWCLDGPNPSINGSKALLSSNSSETMNKQIEALRLEEPVDLYTNIGKKQITICTIVDVTPARVVILGDVNTILNYLKSLGRVFVFRQDDDNTSMSQLRRMIISHYPGDVHSGMLVAGIGGLFGVASGLVGSKILSMNVLQTSELLVVFLAMTPAAFFLVGEAFYSRFIAFRSSWASIFNLLSWFGFLGMLVLPSLMIFGGFPLYMLLRSYQVFSAIIIAGCVVANLGQVYFRQHNKRFTQFVWLWLAVLIISVSLFPTFSRSNYDIQGIGMAPTIEDGTTVIIDKSAYTTKRPERGDIIVFVKFNQNYISRVIGLPGGRIQMKEGHVYVNGARLDEAYLSQGINTQPEGEYLVPPGHIFVLSDNRDMAAACDSRTIGFISFNEIKGKVKL